MPVTIIDTLKPKNGGSFPIVEAIDVFVENYGNLADAISHFATDAMIAAINAVLSGKADSADLAALAAEVDTKADTSALTTTAANLQAQIDNLITPVTQDAEVQNARVGADGASYQTLKERLDSENGSINTDLTALGYKKITIVSTSAHSSSADQSYFKLSSGEEILLSASSNLAETRTVQLWGYVNGSESGTAIGSITNDGEVHKLTSNGNYDKIGFYIQAFSTETHTDIVIERINSVLPTVRESVAARTNAQNIVFDDLKDRLDSDRHFSDTVNLIVSNQFELSSLQNPILKDGTPANPSNINAISTVEMFAFDAEKPVLKVYTNIAIPDGYSYIFGLTPINSGGSMQTAIEITTKSPIAKFQININSYPKYKLYLLCKKDDLSESYQLRIANCQYGLYFNSTSEIDDISDKFDGVYHASAFYPTSETVDVSLGTGGTLVPNNRLYFYGKTEESSLSLRKNDILSVEGSFLITIVTYIGEETTTSEWLPLPITYKMPNNGKVRFFFKNLDDSAFSAVSDLDGNIKIISSLISNIEDMQEDITERFEVTRYSPTGTETGATLSSGGTMVPNNRLNFYTAANPLRLYNGMALSVDDVPQTQIMITTTINGSSETSAWTSLPYTYQSESDNCFVSFMFRHNDVAQSAFNSINDMDGYVHIGCNLAKEILAVNDKLGNAGDENLYPHLINNARYKAEIPLTLLHFSDIHGDTGALSRIMAEYEANSNIIDDVICTGDIVANTSAEIVSWWDERVLTVIGNHDSATPLPAEQGYYDWDGLSMADRDAYYIAPFESNWNITHTSGTSYYYKDYSESKIRMIVLDTMLYSGEGSAEGDVQTSWLSNTIDSAMQLEYSVLIVSHAPHGGSVPINCSFSKYNETTFPVQYDCNLPSNIINLVADKIESGLEFIGYIVGHTHQDNIWDCTGDKSQLAYCVTCAAVSNPNQWAFSDQHRSTTEDAYNIVTIDTTNKLVKIIRGGGANIDRMMRDRKYICINYGNGTIVSE